MRRIVALLFVALASSCCAAPLRVLPIGDSFTAGRNQSYLEPLSALLQRDGIEHEFVGRACELLVPKHPTIAPIVGCSSMRGHQAFWGWTASDVLHGRPGTSLGKLDGEASRRPSAHCTALIFYKQHCTVSHASFDRMARGRRPLRRSTCLAGHQRRCKRIGQRFQDTL
jgi:hypothetical protein